MKVKINQKKIKEMCGNVSFKRGEAFYRANKVTFHVYSAERCEATVAGGEDFRVTIKRDDTGRIAATCTCPSLSSFKKDCQHIAAVLLSISERQREEYTMPAQRPSKELTDEVLNIFYRQTLRSSGRQLHFENRQVLDVQFTCKPLHHHLGKSMLAIELELGSTLVQDIRDFLKKVDKGEQCELSPLFTYDPSLHCFERSTDDVIHQLIQVTHDEKTYGSKDTTAFQQLLIIPPSAWERLTPLLLNTKKVKLENEGTKYEGLQISEEPLPLTFNFVKREAKGYHLKISGLNQLIMMSSYSIILYEGKIIQLNVDDCQRLFELKKMLETSGANEIPIHEDQVSFFLEKVVPGLRKLGDVQIEGTLKKQLQRTPLTAKLFLDRINNRLLAGLEFHYDRLVINPLEGREFPAGSIPLRDKGKEEQILQLMEESQFAKTEGGYFLQNEELEYDFLTYMVPKLEKITQIYATTAVRNRIFRGNGRPQIRVNVQKERTNWLEFKFEMDGIPEKEIKEVLQSIEEKRKYYRLQNGSLLSLETKEFNEINRFLSGLSISPNDLEQGMSVPLIQGLKLLDSVEEEETFKLEKSFHQYSEMLHHPERMKFEVPEELGPVLRDYQKTGFKWLKTLASFGFGGILADDMGLGKTLQSIAYIQSELVNIREKKCPILIVCPSSLTYNWLSELMKFTPEITSIVIDGQQDERRELFKKGEDMDVLITSYPLLRKDIQLYEKEKFHTVFFDEAQAFKNPLTQTAKAVKRINAEYRFALTGTPVENAAEELWSIFHVVFPDLFQGLREYSTLTREKIARRSRPFILRRVKEEVLSELPEKIESVERTELLPEQKKLYGAYLAKLRHETLKHLDKDTIRKNRIKILAGLTRLRQICCHPALFVEGYKGGSAKFDQLMEIVEDSRLSGRRVLIFSQFTKMLDLIGRELANQGRSFFYLDGQTPSEERVEICNRFNRGEEDLFLISLKAGGTGLNLTGADTVILYDIWWNPAVEEQAMDRAHRIGQTNVVQVIKLVARGTIEEKMNELQEKKRHLIDEIISSEEKGTTLLTEEDIREILMT